MAEEIEEKNSSDNEVGRHDWSLHLTQRFHNEKSQNGNVERDTMSESTTDDIPCEYCDAQISFDEWETHSKQCAEADKQRRENLIKRVENDLIPCEYCTAHIRLQDLTLHMNQCAEAERLRIESITSRAANEFIPCEYCNVPVNIHDWSWHMNQCGEAEKKRIDNITKRADNELIPCEYCAVPISIHNLMAHTDQCAAAVRQPRNGLTDHTEGPLIPCQYCDKIFAFQYIEKHQTECQRNQVALTNGFDGQVFGGIFPFPKTWNLLSPYNFSRYILEPNSEEYQFVAGNFHQSMPSNEIVQIERIQNRRWYRQYDAHKDDFIERLGKSTEQWLFHGCKSESIDAIVNDCFNRSHAVRYAAGQGIYFATQAMISYSYTQPDANNIRHMFMARVLVGKTTAGNRSTRVCPRGYDTTGGGTVFVTYHDAQAYGEYLIAFR